MNLVNKINKQAKYCLQNYKHFSCEMCPVRLLAIFLKKGDPAKIRSCMYFITDKKISHYFKDTYDYFKDTYDCYKAIKSSLTLSKAISANKI